jgi:hypothetical protein
MLKELESMFGLSPESLGGAPQVAWVPLFLAVGVTSMDLAALIGFGVPALLIVILTRGRLGYQPDQEQPEAEAH